MIFNFLDTEAIISNKETCCRVLRDNCKELRNKTEKQVAMAVNGKYSSKNDIYFDLSFHITNVAESHYRLLFTGFKNKDGENLYLSCCRNKNGNWAGAFTGTITQIMNNATTVENANIKQLQKELENSNIKNVTVSVEEEPTYLGKLLKQKDIKKQLKFTKEDETEREFTLLESSSRSTSLSNEKTREFYTLLYNRLLVQKGWELNTSALRSYIDAVIARLNFMLEDEEDVSNYLIYNVDKTIVLFNTALLDKFGKPVLVTSRLRGNLLAFTDLQLVDTKATLLKNNFDKEDIKRTPERVEFASTKEDLLFNAEIDDFDLCNYERLTHCIIERRDRFPEYTKNMSDDAICSDMVKAIEMGITLSKYDISYIKPTYNCRYNKINFIIPYHIGNDFNKEPELGIVVAKFDNGLWEVMTILGANECKQDARTLNLYADNSL